MNTIFKQLYFPYLSKLGYYPLENVYSNCGLYFELDSSIGTGYYWVYPVDNLYAVAVYALNIKSDISFQIEHPPFLCLGNYKTSNPQLILGSEITSSESLLGYVGDDDVYTFTLSKGTWVHNVAITLTPEFYKELLPSRYTGDFQSLTYGFSRLNGHENVPEIAMILKQIKAFQPSRDIAKMYYESKVMEIVSLIIQWGKNQLLFSASDSLPDSHLHQLNEVLTYLNENYTNSISLGTLTKIACMSHNKLTNSFKQTYGSTITQYIQSLRVNKAKEMLLDSNWKIGEIANEVGYKLHGSFSEIFKRYTGLTPNEFRKNVP